MISVNTQCLEHFFPEYGRELGSVIADPQILSWGTETETDSE